MPTYDYECEACGHTFERFQEMSARKLRTCPVCGKRKLIRLVGTGAGIIFKGSGFYETDYKRAGGGHGGGNGKAPKAGAPASKDAGSTKDETKTSSAEGKKPAAAKPAKDTSKK